MSFQVKAMADGWWRLLAAFLLILIAALVRGQNAAAGRTDDVPANPQLLLYRPADPMLPFGSSTGSVPLPGPPISRYPHGPGSIGFPQIAGPAAIIFSGTVIVVSRASAQGPHTTAITFKVNQAIRGVSAGQNLTIHEWAGLWSRGESYRVGERVFLFLYSPSRLGLTSPVAGGMGRFTVNSAGQIVLTTPHIHLFATDPILGGKIVASYDDIARAVQRVGLE